MSFFYTLLVRLSQILCSVCSWLTQGVHRLASSLEPAQPAPELPVTVVMTPSFADACDGTFAADEAKIFERQANVIKQDRINRGPPRRFNLDSTGNAKEMMDRDPSGLIGNACAMKTRTHQVVSEASPDFERSLFNRSNVTLRLENADVTESVSSTQLSDIASETPDVVSAPTVEFCSIPASSADSPPAYSAHSPSRPYTPPAPSVTLATPFVSGSQTETELSHHSSETLLPHSCTEVNPTIGELGKRRGFKGAPLFTQATKKRSAFLSPQFSSSPRIPSTNTIISRSPGPRTPLATVTSFIRASTPKSAKTPGRKFQIVSQELQGLYDQSDPFAISADSFFSSEISFLVVPVANVNNLYPYQRDEMTSVRTPPVQSKSGLRCSRTTPAISRAANTTVYDMSIHDVARKKPLAKPQSRIRSTKRLVRKVTNSPAIDLIPPSPTKADHYTAVILPVPDPRFVDESSHPHELLLSQTHGSTAINVVDDLDTSGLIREPSTERSLPIEQGNGFNAFHQPPLTAATGFMEMSTIGEDVSGHVIHSADSGVPAVSPSLAVLPSVTVSGEDLFVSPPSVSLVSDNLVDGPCEPEAGTVKRPPFRLYSVTTPLPLAGCDSSASPMASTHNPLTSVMRSNIDSDVPDSDRPKCRPSKLLGDLITVLDATMFEYTCTEDFQNVLHDRKRFHRDHYNGVLLSKSFAV